MRYSNIVGIRETIRGVRYATSSLRGLPDFVIIGAQKSGTTSLHKYLAEHPRIIKGFPKKELHFFDRDYARGVRWYRSSFPMQAYKDWLQRRHKEQFLAGESTPYYMFHPRVPERMAALMPDVKLIALLRNPVDRAISHYFHVVRKGFEHLDIESAIAKEDERLHGERERLIAEEGYQSFAHRVYSYLARGRYAEQLELWLRYYPKNHLLVIRSEDLFGNTQETVNNAFRFLGCEPYQVSVQRKYNQFAHPQLDDSVRQRLVQYFEPHNARLANLLGFDPEWT